MSQPLPRRVGRPPTGRIRVIIKLSPEANRRLAQAAKHNDCSKGELIEHWLGLLDETKKAPNRAGASQKKH